MLGPPRAVREASDQMLVVAQIQLLDESAQTARKLDLNLHP